MTRPRLLDLFCGAGGAGMGYHRAGFDVTGVDLVDQPRYPFEFHRADAMTFPLDGFDVIHASPPCQAYTALRTLHDNEHPDLIAATRGRLVAHGAPFVIENVVGAPLPGALMLCGAAFGLGAVCRDGVRRPLRRHRLFESSVFLFGGGCACGTEQVLGVYGHGGGAGSRIYGYTANLVESRTGLGVGWMDRREVSQAIPPAYTEFVGRQLIDHLTAGASTWAIRQT